MATVSEWLLWGGSGRGCTYLRVSSSLSFAVMSCDDKAVDGQGREIDLGKEVERGEATDGGSRLTKLRRLIKGKKMKEEGSMVDSNQ